ncbi:hypothetical protein D3C80_1482320 [compost metagenome]
MFQALAAGEGRHGQAMLLQHLFHPRLVAVHTHFVRTMAGNVQCLAHLGGDFEGEFGQGDQQVDRADPFDHFSHCGQQLRVLVHVLDLHHVGDLLARRQHAKSAGAVDHITDAVGMVIEEGFVAGQFVVPALAVVEARPAVDDHDMHGFVPCSGDRRGLRSSASRRRCRAPASDGPGPGDRGGAGRRRGRRPR